MTSPSAFSDEHFNPNSQLRTISYKEISTDATKDQDDIFETPASIPAADCFQNLPVK